MILVLWYSSLQVGKPEHYLNICPQKESVATGREPTHRMGGGSSQPRCHFLPIRRAIRIPGSQCLTRGMHFPDSPFLDFPPLTIASIRAISHHRGMENKPGLCLGTQTAQSLSISLCLRSWSWGGECGGSPCSEGSLPVSPTLPIPPACVCSLSQIQS